MLLAPPCQPTDNFHQLGGSLFLVSGWSSNYAVVSVVGQQAERDLVKSTLDCRDLGDYVDAVSIVVDHLLQAAYLAFDTRQPAEELMLCSRVATGRYVRLLCFHAHRLLPPRGIC